MKSFEQLLAGRCAPLSGAPLPAAEVDAQLVALPGWSREESSIVRDYRFADFIATMAFANAVADMAEREDHHPEMLIGYGRCRLRFDTHSVGGVSGNDFICAAKSDAIFRQLAPLAAR